VKPTTTPSATLGTWSRSGSPQRSSGAVPVDAENATRAGARCAMRDPARANNSIIIRSRLSTLNGDRSCTAQRSISAARQSPTHPGPTPAHRASANGASGRSHNGQRSSGERNEQRPASDRGRTRAVEALRAGQAIREPDDCCSLDSHSPLPAPRSIDRGPNSVGGRRRPRAVLIAPRNPLTHARPPSSPRERTPLAANSRRSGQVTVPPARHGHQGASTSSRLAPCGLDTTM
jgi:hypothetical protein